MLLEVTNDQIEDPDSTVLTHEDKHQIYAPWRHSVIIKAVGKRLSHQYLKSKLEDMWNIQAGMTLLDLELGFFTSKFSSEEQQRKALQQGPWFVASAYLSVRRWKPNFMPSESKIHSTTIWLCLSQLPTEFYDLKILEKVGGKIGELVKVDTCTSSTLRRRYARICVQVPMESQLKTFIVIRNH